MEIDHGRIADDIGRLQTMISRAKGEIREDSFADEWRPVVDLASDILRQVTPAAVPVGPPDTEAAYP
jgi:hypothetical protein